MKPMVKQAYDTNITKRDLKMAKTGPKAYWTAERIVAALKARGEEHGRPLTANEWTRAGYQPAIATIRRVYGGWTAAIAAAGWPIPPMARRKTSTETRQEWIARLRAVGQRVSVQEWNALWAPPTAHAAIVLFGSWNAAWDAAGVPIQSRSEPFRVALHRATRMGIRLSETMWDRLGMTPPARDIIRRFGTWQAFWDAAGVTKDRPGPVRHHVVTMPPPTWLRKAQDHIPDIVAWLVEGDTPDHIAQTIGWPLEYITEIQRRAALVPRDVHRKPIPRAVLEAAVAQRIPWKIVAYEYGVHETTVIRQARKWLADQAHRSAGRPRQSPDASEGVQESLVMVQTGYDAVDTESETVSLSNN